QRGELGQAEAFYRKALALRERLAQDEADAQAQRDLSISYNKLGDLMLQRGELGQAEAFYRKALALSERLAQDEADAQAQRDLGISYERLGDLMLQRGELGQAEAFYRKDLALSERLAQDEADAQAQRDLAVSLERMIRQSIMTKKAEEAGRFLSRMRSVVSRLPGFMRGPFEESIVDFSKEIASLEHGDGG
ncbi:MAG TPA: tetratricopeptide repeat protein, partial [Myxococcota bacterium]|nr:tetratricopeptide repeat protein [Myxococcota bacterium]